jgi:hypothetical protein
MSTNHFEYDPPLIPPGSFNPATAFVEILGQCAVLSDTPEKWASTVALLDRNGIDPTGFVDFERGRHNAIEAAGFRRKA